MTLMLLQCGVYLLKDTEDGDCDLDGGGQDACGVEVAFQPREDAPVGEERGEDTVEAQAHKTHRSAQVMQQHQLSRLWEMGRGHRTWLECVGPQVQTVATFELFNTSQTHRICYLIMN